MRRKRRVVLDQKGQLLNLDERGAGDSGRWYQVRVTVDELGKPRVFTVVCPPGPGTIFKLNGSQFEPLSATGMYEGSVNNPEQDLVPNRLKVGANFYYIPVGFGGHYFGPVVKIEPKVVESCPEWVQVWEETRAKESGTA